MDGWDLLILIHRVQHACGIGSAMRQHCESVNLSMSQISTLDDDLVKDSAEILEIVSKIMNDGNMTKQFEELEEVQRERKLDDIISFILDVFTYFQSK